MIRYVIVAALALGVGCKGKSKPAGESGETEPARPLDPVLVIRAQDSAGAPALFAVDPGGKAPVSIAATDSLEAQTAVVSRSGTALAVVAAGGSEISVHVGQLGPNMELTRVDVGRPVTAVRAVSDDGNTIAVDSSHSVVVVRETQTRTIELSDRLMYGVELSADGSKLAFSTMRADCAGDVERMGKCPVTLYGVDLDAGDAAPRKLAGDGKTVAYDPWFRDDSGSELLYMTNAGDDSDSCAQHVNDCQFQIRSMAWSGGNDRVVIESGVLAREAPDGTIAHRNLAGGWASQTLVIGGRAIEGAITHHIHHFSPNSRWLALERRRGRDLFVDVIDTKGQPTREGVAGGNPSIVGWSGYRLAAGTRRLAEPNSVRSLRRAVEVARQRGGASVAIALLQVSDYAREQVVPDAPTHDGAPDAAKWLEAHPTGFLVTPLFDYCRVRAMAKTARAGLMVDNDAVLVHSAAKPAPAPKLARPPAPAVFELPDGPRLELVGLSLPRVAAVGERVPITLAWRGDAQPPYSWRVFVHFDSTAQRFQADHRPALCKPDYNGKPASYQLDVQIAAPRAAVQPGTYDVYVGWIRGSQRAGDRVKVGSIEIKAAP